MGSVSVSSCRCCMFVSCVHPVAVLNAAFCMTCSLLMLVEDAIGDHTEEAEKLSWRSGKRPRLRARRVKVRFSLRAIILSLENLNVIIRAIN